MLYKLLAVALLWSWMAVAADPEPVLPKTKIIKPVSWYAEQAQSWEQQVQGNAGDAGAWLNYFTACRYSHASPATIQAIVLQVMNAIPDTYEYYLMRGLSAGFTPEARAYLRQASTLQPDNPATDAALLLLEAYEGNVESRAALSKKIYATGHIAASLLSYSYNVLMSVGPGAVLITEGENTALPLFVLQDVLHIRTDVTILQLDLMGDAGYRKRVANTLRLDLDETALPAAPAVCKRTLAAMLPAQNPNVTFYYALTVPQDNIAAIKDRLYVVGLASQLSQDRLDNIPIIRENMERRFLLDHLTVDFNGESEFSSGKVLAANYLVPMLMLYEHYQNNGEQTKARDLEVLINKISIMSGKGRYVANFLNRGKSGQAPLAIIDLNTKAVEGSFKPVNQTLYAGEYEVTNEAYHRFLTYLLQQKQEEQHSLYDFDLSGYDEPALSFMKTYTSNYVATKRNKYFTRHPAVNVSYEAALAYCEWLTQQYNHQEGRKFQKVKFRLPSLREWQIAALGYDKFQSWELDENIVEVNVPKNEKDELSKGFRKIPVKGNDILYPWYKHYNYRNKALNSFGCSLGNFKYPESQKSCGPAKNTGDGFLMMSIVGAYFPNGMGLYDIVGNVAEMIDEKGKACGGSWNHPPEESTIRSINEYNRPNPAIGFRVFMEVIEP